MTQEKEIHIVGGGVSGLFTAYYLVQAGVKVKIFEKKPQVGGLLGTHKTSYGLVEQAANAFIANQELESLCDEIGVKLLEKKAAAKKRYIYRNHKARQWPLGLIASVRVFIFLCLYVFAKKTLRPKKSRSLKDWGELFLGKEACNYLLAPAVQGIYATNPKSLSASLVLKSIFSKPIKKGKLKGSVSPQGGMGEFVEKLKTYLVEKGCLIETQSDFSYDYSTGLVLACDLQSVKPIIKKIKPEAYEIFKNLNSCSLISVTLHFKKSEQAIEGFGCLFPEQEGFHALGVLFNHHIFEGRVEGSFSETWILNDRDIESMDENSIVSLVLKDRKKLYKTIEEPLQKNVFIWKEKIPLYDLELEKALDKYKWKSPIYLIGNYLGDLGLSKILINAKKLSNKIVEDRPWEK